MVVFVSAYIELEPGKSFQISIQPKISYPSKGVVAHDYHARERAKAATPNVQQVRRDISSHNEELEKLALRSV